MLKLYNTLTRKVEELKPVKEGQIGIYSCGPTVYWNQHVGHMYAYTQWDVLVRFLRYQGFQVKWVMNITDVGHMTSDEDAGEDKMEKGAQREGISVWQIAERYIKQFVESMELLNLQKPDVLCRATEHIADQIDLIKKIEANGFTYKTQTGLVFDTSKFSGYAKFAKLNLDQQNAGSRVEVDPEKKNPWDFLLWVTNQPNHVMQWDSPWGKGFPGWHIECTAMSVKYLGNQFDIHTGGKEHVPVHHTNEIAQAYGAFGRQTANCWVHNDWLKGKGGEKMSKSKGNFVTVQDLLAKGINPLALRYLILTSHYRKGLNFDFEVLRAAEKSLSRLYEIVAGLKRNKDDRKDEPDNIWQKNFIAALEDDLNLPEALAVVWEMTKSNLSDKQKLSLLLDWDRILGLKLGEVGSEKWEVSREVGVGSEIKELIGKRELLRKEGKWAEADKVRKQIEEKGYWIEDTGEGSKLKVKRQ